MSSSIILADNNRVQPINLEADNVKYEYKKGIVYYKGHVQASQGSTKLKADEMTVYYNDQHAIKEVVAIGNPAQYNTLVHEDHDQLTARARRISYYPLAGKVILEQQAIINYNNSVFSGPYIFYDLKNQEITSHPQKDSQTKIVLEPIKNILKQN
jgi:lipopolysaccharide export system protein LptA